MLKVQKNEDLSGSRKPDRVHPVRTGLASMLRDQMWSIE
jgi:hypothetical protein